MILLLIFLFLYSTQISCADVNSVSYNNENEMLKAMLQKMREEKSPSHNEEFKALWQEVAEKTSPYNNDPTQLMELTKESTSFPALEKVTITPETPEDVALQHAKTQASYFICTMKKSYGEDYTIERAIVGGLALRGLDIARAQSEIGGVVSCGLLPKVSKIGDENLLKILLEHGADVHESSIQLGRAIDQARTKGIAQLLVEHGAIGKKCEENNLLIIEILRDDCSLDLIPYYRSRGIRSDYQKPITGLTALMKLAIFPDKNIVKKAALLLDGLAPDEKKAFINAKGCKASINVGKCKGDRTVFDFIETYHANTGRHKEELKAFKDFLEAQLIS